MPDTPQRCIILALLGCLPAVAQEAPGGAAKETHWTGTVGAMAVSTPANPGSSRARTLLLPTFNAQYGRFYVGSSRVSVGFGAGLQVWGNRTWSWDLGLGVGDRRPEGRAPELAGMGDRGFSSSVGTGLQWKSQGWEAKGTLAHGFAQGAGNRGSLGLGRRVPLAPRWILSLGLNATWADASAMAYDFGIDAEQAAARRKLVATEDAGPFTPGAGIRNLDGSLSLAFVSGPRTIWHFSLMETTYPGPARHSPLVSRTSTLSVAMGFSYRFGEGRGF